MDKMLWHLWALLVLSSLLPICKMLLKDDTAHAESTKEIIKRKRKHIKNGRNTDDFTHLVESSFCSGRNDSILDSLPQDERSMKIFYNVLTSLWASQVALVVKNPLANAGDIRDAGLIPG